MRLLFGIILGCLLTVGGAYVVDTMAPTSPGARMVTGTALPVDGGVTAA